MTGTAEPGRVGDRDGHARHEDACAAALVELAGMTPVRLARILDGMGPSVAWAALASAGRWAEPRGARSAARWVLPVPTHTRRQGTEWPESFSWRERGSAVGGGGW